MEEVSRGRLFAGFHLHLEQEDPSEQKITAWGWGLGWECLGVTAKGYKVSFWGNQVSQTLVVAVTQICEYIRSHSNVHS